VPVVVLGGMMPTNALSKSPRSKFTAPRPTTGAEASCQHSRRAALLAAEMAVMLKAVAWLTAPPTRASMVISEVNSIVGVCEPMHRTSERIERYIQYEELYIDVHVHRRAAQGWAGLSVIELKIPSTIP